MTTGAMWRMDIDVDIVDPATVLEDVEMGVG